MTSLENQPQSTPDRTSGKRPRQFDSPMLRDIDSLISGMDRESVFLQINIDACEMSRKKEDAQQKQEYINRQKLLETIVRDYRAGNASSLIVYAQGRVQSLLSQSKDFMLLAEKRAGLVVESQYWSEVASSASSACAPYPQNITLN